MRCSTVRKNMFLYFENKLSPKKKEKIAEHLRNCAWCISDYRKGEHMLNVMHSGYPKELPESLHRNIMTEVYSLKSTDEEYKKEVRHKIIFAIRRASVAIASFVLVCILINAINFDYMIEKGNSGVENISNHISDMMNSKSRSASKASNEMSKMMLEDTYENKELDIFNITDNAAVESNEMSGVDLGTGEAPLFKAALVTGDALEEEESLTSSNLDFSDELSFDYSEYKVYTEMKTAKFDELDNEVSKAHINANVEIASKQVKMIKDKRVLEAKIRLKYKEMRDFVSNLSAYGVVVKTLESEISGTERNNEINTLIGEMRAKLIENQNILNESSDVETTNALNKEQEDINATISVLERELQENVTDENEYVSLGLVVNEVSELEFKGIISGGVFWNAIIQGSKNGYSMFIRIIQDIVIWIASNFLFIITGIIAFIIIFTLLKKFLINND